MRPSPAVATKEIAQRLDNFDLLALLRLLDYWGYKQDQIWFGSHNCLASQSRIIQRVTLTEDSVLITINLGLLSPTGELPNYLRRFSERTDVNGDAFLAFLQFYEHVLLSQYIGQLYPEINRDYFESWESTKTAYLQLQNMRTESALHWLFQTAFPECLVDLSYDESGFNYSSQALVVGRKALTESFTFGDRGHSTSVVPHISLGLRWQAEPLTHPWLAEARLRLEQWVFPLLAQLEFSVCIDFYLSGTERGLRLDSQAILGSDCFGSHNTHCSATRLHNGLISSAVNFSEPVKWVELCRIQI
jgi:hypothetical protein